MSDLLQTKATDMRLPYQCSSQPGRQWAIKLQQGILRLLSFRLEHEVVATGIHQPSVGPCRRTETRQQEGHPEGDHQVLGDAWLHGHWGDESPFLVNRDGWE